MDAWKPAPAFKHDDTKYPLTGKHIKVECIKCHKIEKSELPTHHFIPKRDGAGTFSRYKPLEFASCITCHKDVHNNKFGPDCASCHVTNTWAEMKSKRFDHSKTVYPLVGKHITVTCAKCHTSGKTTDKLKFALCMDCHRDYHKEQFPQRTDGPECKSCHIVEGWIPSNYGLEQHQQSRYPLTGGHLATPCGICHKPEEREGAKIARYAYPDLACKVCHEDIHQKEADKWMILKGCDACHTPESWKVVKFDHSKSKYPLDGRHKTTACGACHSIEPPLGGKKIVKLTELALNCAGCHKDEHQEQFTVEAVIGECSRCHTPASWKWLRFNHNDARYKLDGAHSKVACDKCHQTEMGTNGKSFVRYRPVPMACSDCHTGNIGK